MWPAGLEREDESQVTEMCKCAICNVQYGPALQSLRQTRMMRIVMMMLMMVMLMMAMMMGRGS